MNTLLKDSENKSIEDTFRQRCEAIVQAAESYFNQEAYRYMDYQTHRESLTGQIFSTLQKAYDRQIQRVQTHIKTKF